MKLISLLVRGNHTKPITKIVLFKVFLGKLLQIPFREVFLRNDYDFILEVFYVNDIPKISSLSIHFNLLPQKLFKIYLMWNARLDAAQAGIKIPRRNINNLRYADDTNIMAESKEELKSLLMKVKEESENAGLKLNNQKS